MERFRLDGKIALVTGAGSPTASAWRPPDLARLGAVVTIAATTDRIADRQRELAAEGLTVDTGIADLSSLGRRSARRRGEARHGRIDVLVNNAGMVQTGIETESRTLATMSEADWDFDIQLNLKTCFTMTRAVVPGMIERATGGSCTSPASPARWSQSRPRPGYRPARPASRG